MASLDPFVREHWAGTILAIEDEARAGLDVERLALVLAILDPQGRMAGIVQPPLVPRDIAADLLALTQPAGR